MKPTQTKPGYWYRQLRQRRGPAMCRMPDHPNPNLPRFLEPYYGEYVLDPYDSLYILDEPPAHVRWFGSVPVLLDDHRLCVGSQVYDHRELIDMMQWLANRLGYEFRRKVKEL